MLDFISNIGNEVWLSGKGISFDKYDWKKAGPGRFALNEMAFVQPSITAAIAQYQAPLKRYISSLPKGVPVITIKTEPEYFFKQMMKFDIEQTFKGTVTLASCILEQLGMRKIHYVGFDSLDGDGTFSRHILRLGARGRNRDNYAEINRELLDFLEGSSIQPIWEHRNV